MQHRFGLDIPQTLDEVCDPERMALIVYDMQIGVLRQIEDADRIIAQVTRVLDAARAAGVRVFFMRHRSLPKELMGVFQYRMAMAWQRTTSVEQVTPWFLPDSPGFPLTPEIAPLPSEAVLDKITMSAFEGTPLNIALRDCGIVAFHRRGGDGDRHRADRATRGGLGLHPRGRHRCVRRGRRGRRPTLDCEPHLRGRRDYDRRRDHLRGARRETACRMTPCGTVRVGTVGAGVAVR